MHVVCSMPTLLTVLSPASQQEMVCVEAAVAPSGPVVVKPGAGAAWQATQTLIYEPSS
jgi:hypothetical protein